MAREPLGILSEGGVGAPLGPSDTLPEREMGGGGSAGVSAELN